MMSVLADHAVPACQIAVSDRRRRRFENEGGAAEPESAHHDLDANGNRYRYHYTQTCIDPDDLNKFKIRDFEQCFATAASTRRYPLSHLARLRAWLRY